jgi:cell division protein ZipA
MPELRLTLLVVGLIFLVGLAWWELRRAHQARGSDLSRVVPDSLERVPPTMNRRGPDPDLELPRMSARDPESELPVVELEPADFAALEAQAQTEYQAEDPPEDRTEDQAEDATEAPPEMNGMEGLLDELGASQVPDPPISDIAESFAPALEPGSECESEPEPQLEPEPEPELAPAAETVAAPVGAPAAATAVVVEWPQEEASRVIAVRLVNRGEKFSGRAVRMALAAEGFVLGKFSIFHKPAPDGRALLSIASLNKPGTFDASSIDLQRYSGLNLFTVLPGPLPALDAVDELLACAHVLCQRLHGVLQDSHGEPLSPAQTALMRSSAATLT